MKVYHTHRELHMIGDYVAVAWNTRKERRSIRGEDGLIYTADVPVRSGGPYIDFVMVSEGAEGEWYEDDDSPADGGFSADVAEQFARELSIAAAYLRAQKEAT